MSTWINYFVTSLAARGGEGLIEASKLRDYISAHDGHEAYHCAFDLVQEQCELEDGGFTTKGYKGIFRPAMGYVWFDFDSHDGGVQAHNDTKKFVEWLGFHDAFICYSGSKGFHVGVPFGYFGLDPSRDLGVVLNGLAKTLKQTYPSLDTTVFNANRKFRALGSRHPKTGLFKVRVVDLDMSLDEIKEAAKIRGILEIPIAALRSPLPHVVALFHVEQNDKPLKSKDNVAMSSPKTWDAPTGEAAFAQCGFLARCKANPASISEPEWYAALSVVSRFQEGRKQAHSLSDKHPGYSVNECNKKIDQALALPPRTCENINTLWDGCKECPLWGKINSPVNLYERKFWDISKKGALIPKYNELLKHFEKKNAFKTIADMKSVFVYNGTYYEECTPIELKAFAEQSFEPKPQEKHRQEFCHKVFSNSVARRNFFIDTTQNRINFKNGILELDSDNRTNDLRIHSSDVGFRGMLPYNYDPSSTSPTFTWWINDVMLGDESLVKILQEYMGYVIRGGDYKYHKALWLSGSGRNGKSTFLSVLKALIGTGNYSTLSIKQIIGDKFSSADLDGRIANFSEETSPEELSDSGPFKNLTGDGEINAQKKYGDPYSFRNRAKLIMTYNEVPELRDLSPGMLSRPIIIPFQKDLTKESSQDKKLKAKLLAELPGIFNFALEGWRRLESQESFTYSPKAALEMDRVKAASCSALQWLSNYVTFLPIDANSANKETLTPMELYEAYQQTEGRYSYKATKFFRRINEHDQIKERRKTTKNSAVYFSLMIKRKSGSPMLAALSEF